MAKIKKKVILIVTFSLLACFVSYFIYSHKSKAPSAPFITVENGDIVVKVTAVGNIVSANTAAVKSSISGIVADIFHQEGDLVKKSDSLLTVKPQPTPKDYATITQQVEIDLVEEKNTLSALQRYEALFNAGAIAENDKAYENAKKDYETSKLKRELDQKILALVEEGKTDIQDKTINNIIVSPIDGYVVERLINLGDPVTAQTEAQAGNILFSIADMSALIFRGEVSEADAAKLQLGVTAIVKIAALPELNIEGKLSQLALQSNQLGATSSTSTTLRNSPFNVGYKVEIDQLDIPENTQLRAGYSATAEVIIDTVKNTLIVPERVLQFEQDKIYVWRLNKNNLPEKHFVTLGLSDGVHAQIIKGLELGERVLEVPPDSKLP